MKLVIVESPAKAKTIQKYLGRDYVVKSSYGHIRDLPKSTMGVDIEHDFKPRYIVPVKAKANVKELQASAKKADMVYLATDEDREGEAIAWHIVEALKLSPEKTKRITFTEITKNAIQNAVQNPREIDSHLVDAQQARRVLDRLVGYELSPLLWKKVRRGLSAGRVQSVAVRLIADREEEIAAFKPEEYWSIEATLRKSTNSERAERVEELDQRFTAKLVKKDGQAITKLGIKNKEHADTILSDLEDATYTVAEVTKKERKRTPPPPFTTSTLQQAGSNALGYSSKRTMMLAQHMYENGFITYMRTDSTNLAAEATAAAKAVITDTFGARYALAAPRVFAKKSKGAQEAHEAIRPTDMHRAPESLAGELEPAELKVYRLIWQRALASQMREAIFNMVSADIKANDYTFRANGTTVAFDGFLKVLSDKSLKETNLPELTQGDALNLEKLAPEQHYTQPPARYTEASLVKALEEAGVGRPSTYAPTIDTIQKREYVKKRLEDKRFEPTEVGVLVNKLLKEHFPSIVDIGFTADVELALDKIAEGGMPWQPVIKDFYVPFHATIEKKGKELNKKDFTEEKTGEKCPKDGGELVIKLGRFGKFKACSNYPECKYTEPIGEEKQLKEEHTGKICPDCGKTLVVKRGRFGPFIGCSGYPDCKHIEKIEKDTGLTCPKCNKGKIVERRSRQGKIFYACNRYPDCQNAYWSKPTGEACPNCGSFL
ncbi:MAG: type I DNA topoisomerase, partial [Patescibacteria group bacterium]